MSRSQHGHYALRVLGHVLVCKVGGDWNEIAVQNLFVDASLEWGGFSERRWGLLVDAREWGAATPEAVVAWEHSFELGAIAAGAVCIATVFPSNFHRLMVEALARRLAQRCDHHTGLDIDTAWEWLQSRGLSIT
jgi:hypothetical protein